MYCAIYKSAKKDAFYLYIKQKNVFVDVPEPLLNILGILQFVMMVNLNKRDKLAVSDISNVRKCLQTQGFYLQLPPSLDASLHHIRIQNTKL